MHSVLIIEDDKDISDLISIHLKDNNFEVVTAFDGKQGLVNATNNNYSLIVLDLMLPELDGMEVCKQLRINKVNTPILILTSRAEEFDKVLGLELGADDYLTKPFSIREMVARVKAIIRRHEITRERSKEDEDQELHFNNLYVNIEKRKVIVRNQPVDLSPKEFDLLVFLASKAGKTFSREQLLNQIWGVEFEGFEHTVNSHINRLRSKIEQDLNHPEFILTTWGVGYRFKED